MDAAVTEFPLWEIPKYYCHFLMNLTSEVWHLLLCSSVISRSLLPRLLFIVFNICSSPPVLLSLGFSLLFFVSSFFIRLVSLCFLYIFSNAPYSYLARCGFLWSISVISQAACGLLGFTGHYSSGQCWKRHSRAVMLGIVCKQETKDGWIHVICF